ncbi:hypothetical protein [Photorhabdus antumapuensis]|uniref:hypothetical protein n=1 Tax=Photorhabdus antumapuensis TaxID=2862867 RepID=UPI001CEDEC61|nr:hypothetical protein [Photorhabdus antumapuensis]MCA6220383.1 hypothetical protein [Photorhabdus antumapuensis]
MPDEALQQPKHKTVGIFENYQEIIPDDKLSYFENEPSITLHVAPQGAPVVEENGLNMGKSLTGHVFYTIRNKNPKTGNFESITAGLSPGEDWDTVKDNLSFNDHIRYPTASSLTIVSQNLQFLMDLDMVFQKTIDYRDGKTQPPSYNVLTSNCIDFVKDTFHREGGHASYSGITLNLEKTPNQILKQLFPNPKKVTKTYRTPLVIDLNGDGVQTVTSELGVVFDFNGQGQKVNTGWVDANDSLLVWDKNNDGLINRGSELFGEDSQLSSGEKAQHGFMALADIDSNQDGIIDNQDVTWNALKIWQDRNLDGLSTPDELKSLEETDIKSMQLNYQEINYFDLQGNYHGLTSTVNWSNGYQTEITDVWFKQDPVSIYEAKLSNELHDLINAMACFVSQQTEEINSTISSETTPIQLLTVNLIG